MKRYIIRTEEGEAFNAASKARRDAEEIALQHGYELICFKGGRTAEGSVSGAVSLAMQALQNWIRLIWKTEPGSLVLLQYPHYPMKTAYLVKPVMMLAKLKGLRFTALVHDLDSVRGLHGTAAVYSDRRLLPCFDAIICHNDRMRKHLIRQGIKAEKLVVLGIFDYLSGSAGTDRGQNDGLAVAGNLSSEKSGYIYELIRHGGVRLHLYGKGLEGELPGQIDYHGAFPPEELPGLLEGSYGVVWDGPFMSSCSGKPGEYLRFNDPHKYSLYMAAGLPVIIWKQAALADFAERTGTGIAVDSLENIAEEADSISRERYEIMRHRAETVGRNVRAGAFLERALKRAEIIALKK